MRAIIGKLTNSEMVELYRRGTRSNELARQSGIPIRRVRTILQSAGIELKAGWEYLKVNNQNDNYFEVIDSPDKAYFLGLLYADGNVYLKRNRIQLTLQNQDIEIMTKFTSAIGYTGPLYTDRDKYTKLIICSKKMVQDLIKLGCVPKKSLILEFPKELPGQLVHHFVRGYFDGDGSVSVTQLQEGYRKFLTCTFTSTKMFCHTLSELLTAENIDVKPFRRRFNFEESAGDIVISRKDSTRLLYHYMYENCGDLFLSRKKLKFEEVI